MSRIVFLLLIVFISSCENPSSNLKKNYTPAKKSTEVNATVSRVPNSSMLNLEQLFGPVKKMVKTISHATDKNGKVIKVANGNKYSLTFDSFGNGIERHYFNSQGKEETYVIYQANAAHHLFKATEFSSSKKIQKLFTYQTNSARQILEMKCMSTQGKLIYQNKYEYSTDGKILQERKLTSNGIDNVTTKYIYNSKGDCIQTDFFKKGNILYVQSKSTFTKFDSHGNWLTCIDRTNKGSVFLVQREIEYY